MPRKVHLLKIYYHDKSTNRFELTDSIEIFTTQKKALSEANNRIQCNAGFNIKKREDSNIVINYEFEGKNGYGQSSTARIQYIIEEAQLR